MMEAAELSQKDESKKLPLGWRWVQLGEVARIFAGSAAPQGKDYFDPKGPPFVRVSDLGAEKRTTLLREVRDRLSAKAVKECSLVLAKEGTILFPKSGAAIATNNRALLGMDAYIVSHLMAMEPTDKTTSLWLYWSLCHVDMTNYSNNVGYPSLKQSTVEKIKIPLPPLFEQKRIAAILSDQMEAVERARAAAEAQLEAAKALPAAYLRAVFNSPEAQKWPKERLGDVGEIVSGVTLGRRLNGLKTRVVPYLRVANVKDGILDLSDVYRIEATEEEIRKLRLKVGDLLLTEGGDPDKLGRGTFWEGQIPECIHQNHIFRVRFDLNRYSPQFVSGQIGSPYGKSYFLTHAKQTTGIATINQQVLAAFPLMTPSFEEQQQIVACVSEQMAAAERTRKALEEQLDTINKLPAALLRRAFNGEV